MQAARANMPQVKPLEPSRDRREAVLFQACVHFVRRAAPRNKRWTPATLEAAAREYRSSIRAPWDVVRRPTGTTFGVEEDGITRDDPSDGEGEAAFFVLLRAERERYKAAIQRCLK